MESVRHISQVRHTGPSRCRLRSPKDRASFGPDAACWKVRRLNAPMVACGAALTDAPSLPAAGGIGTTPVSRRPARHRRARSSYLGHHRWRCRRRSSWVQHPRKRHRPVVTHSASDGPPLTWGAPCEQISPAFSSLYTCYLSPYWAAGQIPRNRLVARTPRRRGTARYQQIATTLPDASTCGATNRTRRSGADSLPGAQHPGPTVQRDAALTELLPEWARISTPVQSTAAPLRPRDVRHAYCLLPGGAQPSMHRACVDATAGEPLNFQCHDPAGRQRL